MAEMTETPVSEGINDMQVDERNHPDKTATLVGTATLSESSASDLSVSSHPLTSSANATELTAATTPVSGNSSSVMTEATSCDQTKPKQLVGEQLTQAWENLGVHRCPNCKFTTDDEELFKNHATLCSTPKSSGMVKFSCADNEFKCLACDGTTWKNQAEFEEHIVIHIQDQPYVCLTCKKDFPSRRLIELHVKFDHSDGVARSGLRGMKKARLCIQDLLEKGSVNIQGKRNVPKTPHNQCSVSNKQDGAGFLDANSKINSGLTTAKSQETALKLVTDSDGERYSLGADKVGTVQASRPMPPPRISPNLSVQPSKSATLTSKSGTLVAESPREQAKNVHLNSLFGELNTSNNSLQPTYVSQKIKNIANPTGTVHHKPIVASTVTDSRSNAISDVVLSATDRTRSLSNLSPHDILLVPVGTNVIGPPPSNIPLSSILIPSTTSPNLHVPLQQMNQVRLSGGQVVVSVSSVQSLLPPIVSTNTGPSVSLSSQVGASTGQISLITGLAPVQTPPPPYPTVSSVLSGMSLAQDAANLQALQNLADLVCPAKQPAQTITTFSKTQHLQANQFINVAQLVPPMRTPVLSGASSLLVSENQLEKKKSDKGAKFLFRVNSAGEMVCEVCKKFTKREFVFREHLWGHFHKGAVACRKCSSKNIQLKEVNRCVLVNDIVASLLKQQRNETSAIQSSKTEAAEVIDITDDDNDESNDKEEDKQNATEVIVLDDDEDRESNGGLQIKIASIFSITSCTDLEQMSKDYGNCIEGANNTMDGAQSDAEVVPVETEVPSAEMENSQYGSLKELLKSNVSPKDKEEEAIVDQELNRMKQQFPDDDDVSSVAGKELVEKSLTEPGTDSESIVSQILETNLKEFDPTKKACEKAVDEIDDTSEQNSFHSTKESSSVQLKLCSAMTVVASEKDEETVGKHHNEEDIPTKQSQWAFYVCGYEGCSFTCFLSSKYKEHLQSSQHVKEYNYICGHCGQKDYNVDSHVRHVFSHASAKSFVLYKCPIRQCKYKTNLRHLYIVHLKAHPTEELLIKCIYCNKTFYKLEDLEHHLKLNLLKFIVCPLCSFKFGDRSVVMKHMRDEHPERLRFLTITSQIVCNEREINFYTPPRSKLLDVVEPEGNRPPEENLDIPGLLDKVDSKEVKSNKANAEKVPVNVASDNEDALSLPEEDQSEFDKIGDQSMDKKHEKSKGRPSGNLKVGPKLLLCPNCTYLSYNQAFYSQHLSLHDVDPNREKRFICNLCPLSTDAVASFRKHMSNHIGRNEVKILNCTSCSYSSNQKCHIMDHVRDAHATPVLYTLNTEIIESNHFECNYCDFKARTVEQINTHKVIVHRVDNTASTRNTNDNNDDSGDLSSQYADNEAVSVLSANNESDVPKKKLKYHCEYCNQFFKHKANLKEHLSEDHSDIQDKQFIFFKCKYCAYTSTMKERIISHLEKEHNNLELRIMRKIETVESKSSSTGQNKVNDKETTNAEKSIGNSCSKREEITNVKPDNEVVIPDGNAFKPPFKCPKCDFTASTRLKTMLHLKTHPELKPVRPDLVKPQSKKTARKSSTSSMVSPGSIPKRYGALTQDIPVLESSSKNPFTAVKQSVVEDGPGVSDGPIDTGNHAPDPYPLGEQNLHSALSACFIPSEQNMNFQCRICKQRISKKFVLHRHILNHLKIVFFRCHFCDEGSIEKTLMVGHIQKCHPQLPILFSSVDKTELESTFKEKIFGQNFNDIVDLRTESVPIDRGIKETNRIDIVKKQVLEYQTIEDSDQEDSENKDTEHHLLEDNKDIEEDKPAVKEEKISVTTKKTKGPYKCPKCRHVAHKVHFAKSHAESHNDPTKTYTCSVCDFRGNRFSVIKHIYRVYHASQPVVIHDNDKLTESHSKDRMESLDSSSKEIKTVTEDAASSANQICESSKRKDKGQTIIKSSSYAYKLKTVFKCKECGEKRESRSSMYDHFKTSKCNKPMYKCSLCSFVNKLKSVINSHAAKRHHGKKFTVLTMKISSKFRTIKFPVKQTVSTQQLNTQSSMEEVSSQTSSGSGSPLTVLAEEEDGRLHCQLCSKYVCETVMKLQYHVITSHQGVKLQCKMCSYKTPLVQHMINHCRNVHLQKIALYGTEKCLNVNKVSVTNKTEGVKAGGSSSNKVEFKCPKCAMTFSNLKCVQTHLYVHFKYKPFKCAYCDYHNARSTYSKRHCERTHPNRPAKIVIRKIPAIEAKMQRIYDSVKLNVSKQRIYLGLSRPSKLDGYELIEEGVRRHGDNYHCDICNFSAIWKYQVKKHILRIHRKRSLENDSDSEELTPPLKMKKLVKDGDNVEDDLSKSPLKYKVIKTLGVKKLQCLECDYQTEKIKYMKQHMRRAHGTRSHDTKSRDTRSDDATEGDKNDEKTYNCFYCSYSSIHASTDIKRHMKVHHPSMPIKVLNRFGVLISGDKNDSRSSLSPARSVSNSPARSSVSNSPARSSVSNSPGRSVLDFSKESLPKPSNQITGKTKFSCNLCQYSTFGYFHFRLHLLRHKEFTQLSTKLDSDCELACGYCSYSGKNNFQLNTHIATHMAEMRYKCAYCDYNQFQCAKVQLHLKYAHPDQPELVVDRKKKKFTTGALKLVNFSPVLNLQRIKQSVCKKKFRRIIVETSESSDDSDDESGEKVKRSKTNINKTPEIGLLKSKDEIPLVNRVQMSMKIKTSRAANLFKTLVGQGKSEQLVALNNDPPSIAMEDDKKIIETVEENEHRSNDAVEDSIKNISMAMAYDIEGKPNDRSETQTDTYEPKTLFNTIEPKAVTLVKKCIFETSKKVELGDLNSDVQSEIPETQTENHGQNEQDESMKSSEEAPTELNDTMEKCVSDSDGDKLKEDESENNKQLFMDIEPATQVYDYETQAFDAEEVAKCYDETSNDSEEAEELLLAVGVEKCNKSKHGDGIKESENRVDINFSKQGDINAHCPDEGRRELDKLSTEGSLECVVSDSQKNDMQTNMKDDQKKHEDSEEENQNVFEKFSCNFDANSDVSKQNDCNEEDSDQEREANIFEKFNQNKTEDDDSPVEDVSKNPNIEEEESEVKNSNIFDKFEFSNKDSNEMEKESDDCDEGNVFDKFGVSDIGNKTEEGFLEHISEEALKVLAKDKSVVSESEPKDTSVGSKSEPKDKSVVSESEPKDKSVVSESEPKDTLVLSESEPKDTLVLSESEPKDKSVVSESEPKDTLVLSESEPKDTLVLSESEPKDTLVLSESEPKDTLVLSVGEPKNSSVVSESEPKDKSEVSESEHYVDKLENMLVTENVGEKIESDFSRKEIACRSDKEMFEDMEVDELINSIEETVNQSMQADSENQEKSDMDLG